MVAVTFESALQRINEQARPYPAYRLPEGGTGLCLFSAGFLGWNDAIHFARKRMITTCVDIDAPKLTEMADMYPPNWRFFLMDAWDFALDALDHHDMWDAVSVDTFTGEPEARSLRSLNLWCALARELVTVTCSKDSWGKTITREAIPDGWNDYVFERSSDVDWLVLTNG